MIIETWVTNNITHVKENKWHAFLPVVTKMETLVCSVRHEAACIYSLRYSADVFIN